MEPIDYVGKKLRENETTFFNEENVSSLKCYLNNKRNFVKLWRTFVDSLSLLKAQNSVNPIASGLSLFKNACLLNEALDSGELPLALLLSREPKLGGAFLQKVKYSPNIEAKSGETLALSELANARSYSLDHMDNVLSIISHPDFDLSSKDQGAQICFTGLSWLLIAYTVSDDCEKIKKIMESLIKLLYIKGFDLNSPRSRQDVIYGSKINTPISYCIKKSAHWLEMKKNNKLNEKLGEGLQYLCELFLEYGANPSLQAESTQKIELLALCEKNYFPKRLMSIIEGGIIFNDIKEKSEQKAPLKGSNVRL